MTVMVETLNGSGWGELTLDAQEADIMARQLAQTGITALNFAIMLSNYDLESQKLLAKAYANVGHDDAEVVAQAAFVQANPSQPAAAAEIKKERPFYKKWWVIGSVLALAATGGVLFARSR